MNASLASAHCADLGVDSLHVSLCAFRPSTRALGRAARLRRSLQSQLPIATSADRARPPRCSHRRLMFLAPSDICRADPRAPLRTTARPHQRVQAPSPPRRVQHARALRCERRIRAALHVTRDGSCASLRGHPGSPEEAQQALWIRRPLYRGVYAAYRTALEHNRGCFCRASVAAPAVLLSVSLAPCALNSGVPAEVETIAKTCDFESDRNLCGLGRYFREPPPPGALELCAAPLHGLCGNVMASLS